MARLIESQRLRWGAGSVVVVTVVWLALGVALASGRGLDITDEGLYLLAADPPSLTAVWNVPWGWHTRPLFALVGYDIATFRTLGSLLLVLAGGAFGLASTRALAAHAADRAVGDPVARGVSLAAAMTGGVGMLLYYDSLLRTPSYNWVNLFGVLVFATGVLWSWSQDDEAVPGGWRSISPGAAVSALGLVVAFPAKPTTPLALAALGVLVAVTLRGWRAAVRWLSLTSVLCAAYMAMAVLVKLWPLDFVSVVQRSLQMPRIESQTLGGALRSTLDVPREILGALSASPRAGVVLAVVGLLLLLVPPPRAHWRMTTRTAGLAAVGVAGLSVASGDSPSRILAAALVILLGASAAAATASGGRAGSPRTAQGRTALVLLAFTVALPLIFGFGSSNGTAAQASLAAGILLATAPALMVLTDRNNLPVISALLLLALTTLLTAATIGQGRESPYRIPPMSEQTTVTDVGEHGARLALDPDLAAVIHTLREQAEESGWKTRTPLVGLAWRWSSTIPYALGARVPESLMVTLFGYPVSQQRLEFSLGPSFADFPYADAWLLTSTRESLTQDSRAEVDRALASLSNVSGRDFPKDYSCVGAAGAFELWRPVPLDTAPPTDTAGCPAPAPVSRYDASRGWTGSDWTDPP